MTARQKRIQERNRAKRNRAIAAYAPFAGLVMLAPLALLWAAAFGGIL